MNALFNVSPQKASTKNLVFSIASAEVKAQISAAIAGLHCELTSTHSDSVRPALAVVELGDSQIETSDQIENLRSKWPGIQVLGLASWQSLYEGKLTPKCVVDDLLFLPAKPMDFQYRVKRHLANQLDISNVEALLTFGSIQFDLQSLQIKIAEKKLRVTKREYELLLYFARQAPRPVTHREIADKVLRLAHSITTYENVINVHVARVRAKLKEISEEHRLTTLRGAGFVLDI
jgi:DNA-binding response OmpR family regulator